jgi:hypothetical protein
MLHPELFLQLQLDRRKEFLQEVAQTRLVRQSRQTAGVEDTSIMLRLFQGGKNARRVWTCAF